MSKYDEVIENVAKALYCTEANSMYCVDSTADSEIKWQKHLAFYKGEGDDPMGFFPVFMLAKRALSAAGLTEEKPTMPTPVTSLHWGKMKRELMEWMNEYAEIHGPDVNLRRPSHRASLAYFLACKITKEQPHDDA